MFMAPDSWKELFDNTLAQLRAGDDPALTPGRCRAPDSARQGKARVVRRRRDPGKGDSDVLGVGCAPCAGALRGARVAGAAEEQWCTCCRSAPRRTCLVAGDGADDIGQPVRRLDAGLAGWRPQQRRLSPWRVDLRRTARGARGRRRQRAAEHFDGRYRAQARCGDRGVRRAARTRKAPAIGTRWHYQAGAAARSAVAATAARAHVPVVSVFLSGRPLGTNARARRLGCVCGGLAAGLGGRRLSPMC